MVPALRESHAKGVSAQPVAMAWAYGAGSGMAYLAADILPSARTFLVASAITVVTAIFTLLKLDRSSDAHREEDRPHEGTEAAGTKAPLGTLIGRIKASCFATFAYGYFQSSVVLFLPLFMASEKGIPKAETRLITFFVAGGMLLATNVAGRLGDRYGHLLMVRRLAIVGATMIASFVWLNGLPLMGGSGGLA